MPKLLPLRLLLVAALVGACVDDADPGPSEVAEDSGYPLPAAQCGNGFVEAPEECDDANTIDDDICGNDCTIQCGLTWSQFVRPPTPSSLQSAASIAPWDGEGLVLASVQRPITTAQDGTQTTGDNELRVSTFGRDGAAVWDRIVEVPIDMAEVRVATDDADRIFVAASVTDGVLVARLSPIDGAIEWSTSLQAPATGGDNLPRDLEVGPTGALHLSAQLRQGEGDDDVLVSVLDPEGGTELYRALWSGLGNGTFSADDPGPLTVDATGAMFVLANEYMAPQSSPLVLLRFDPDRTSPTWINTVTSTTEPQAPLDPHSLAIHGSRLFVGLDDPLIPFEVQVRGTSDGALLESIPGEQLGVDPLNTSLGGLVASDAGLVVGGTMFFEDPTLQLSIADLWLTHRRHEGDLRCTLVHRAQSDSLLPPNLELLDLTLSPTDAPLVAAVYTSDETMLWVGRFRPPR